MQLRNRRKRSTGKRLLLLLFLLLVGGGGAVSFVLFFEGEKPLASLDTTHEFVGRRATIVYKVNDSRSGIRSVLIRARQNGTEKILFTRENQRQTYLSPAGPDEETGEIVFEAKKEGFADGPLTLTLETTDFSLRGWLTGNKTVITREVIVDTVPPRIEILHSEKYIYPGGSGIAIYRATGAGPFHGAQVNGWFSQGYPIDEGQEDVYISFFALPYDTDVIDDLRISARDAAGNETSLPFSSVLKKPQQKKDTINVSEGFLAKKIPEFQQYYPEMEGQFIDKYLYANSSVRLQNNRKIADLCSTTSPVRFWRGHFIRMPGSSRAGFADHRNYTYQGKTVDHQVHLGMDIASTKSASVPAANKGRVVFADYLGIYGNMVLLDHGQGVFSLYSHLSQIKVSPGDTLEQGAVVGLTGTTGMAGGDHLHFSMLVHGIFVNPKEWWDKHWIEVTVENPIAATSH